MVAINKPDNDALIPDNTCFFIVNCDVARRIKEETSGALQSVFIELFSYLGANVVIQTDEQVRRRLVATARLDYECNNI